MAKETKSTATGTVPAKTDEKAPKAPPVEKGNADIFKAVFVDGKPAEPTKKLPPQAQVILNTVRAAGKAGVARKQLNENLKGVLTTRQPEGRIVTYYQKLLQETGGLTITKSAVPTTAAAEPAK